MLISLNLLSPKAANFQKRRFSQTQEGSGVALKTYSDLGLAGNDAVPSGVQDRDNRAIKQSNTWHAEAPQGFCEPHHAVEPLFESFGEHRDQFYTQRATSFDGRDGPPRLAHLTTFHHHRSPSIFRPPSSMPRFPSGGHEASVLSSHVSPFRYPVVGPPPGLASPQPTKRLLSLNQDLQKCVGESKGKCVALGNPLPRKFQGNMEVCKDEEVPDFATLVNFPTNSVLRQNRVLPNGMRCCVMCGSIRRTCSRLRSRKNDGSRSPGRNLYVDGAADDYVTIPTQNKGLCTICDISVWVVLETGRQIKWCKGCKNFRPWAGFGDKGLATKCVRCRDRQKEKYAMLKDARKNQAG